MKLDPGIAAYLARLQEVTGGVPAAFEAEARRRMLRQRTAAVPVRLPEGVGFEDWPVAVPGRRRS